MTTKQSIIEKQWLLQVLSLDVVLGSVAVGIFAITIFNVQANPWWWAILPMAVWVVYTLDHLLDGFKKKETSSIYRHLFHYRHRLALISIVIVIGTLSTILSIIFLEKEIIFGGFALSAFILTYFGLVFLLDKFNYNHFLKEFIIAFVYIAGIFLAPLVWNGRLPSYPVLLAIVILFFLAWIESVIVSYFDYKNDMADGFKSFTVALGKGITRKVMIAALFTISVFLIIFSIQISNPLIQSALIIELIMSGVLLVLISFPNKFKKQNRFRWIGEAIFYLPALIILL